jgi:hypothetical protein
MRPQSVELHSKSVIAKRYGGERKRLRNREGNAVGKLVVIEDRRRERQPARDGHRAIRGWQMSTVPAAPPETRWSQSTIIETLRCS